MTRFPRVRDVLNKLRHTGQLDHDVRLLVRDRVSGTKEITGDQIGRIAKREFDVVPSPPFFVGEGQIGIGTSDTIRLGAEGSTIPFYKVTVIWQHGERIWERPSP